MHNSPNLLWSGSITCTSSTSTLRNMRRSNFLLSSMKIGAIIRQGPHQVAVKSTTIWHTEKTTQKIMLQPLTLNPSSRIHKLKRRYLIWGIPREALAGRYLQFCWKPWLPPPLRSTLPCCWWCARFRGPRPSWSILHDKNSWKSDLYTHEQKSKRTNRRCRSLVRNIWWLLQNSRLIFTHLHQIKLSWVHPQCIVLENFVER